MTPLLGTALPRDRGRGQALVEFAVVIPIFLLLLMVLLDFGRVIYAQNAINQDAREAARAGSVPVVPATCSATVDYQQCQYNWIRAKATVVQPGASYAATDVTGAPGDCPTNPDTSSPTKTCFYPDGVSSGQRVVVNIQVTVPLITPIISQIVGGSFIVKASAVSFIQCGKEAKTC
jgi:Flp pilus assembly protein TadG